MDDLSLSARVRQLVEPILTPLGLDVFDVEHKGRVLRVTVDRPGGVDLDALSDATRRISDEIDRHDVLPGRCILEVSSPGIERPLRTPEHFRRAVGSKIAVRTKPGSAGERRVEGVLASADDRGIVVGEQHIAYADVDRARTVLDWGNPSGKASGKASGKGPGRAPARPVPSNRARAEDMAP